MKRSVIAVLALSGAFVGLGLLVAYGLQDANDIEQFPSAHSPAPAASAQPERVATHSIATDAMAKSGNVPALPPPSIPCGNGTRRIFYGVAGHVSQGGIYTQISDAEQVSQLRDLGFTLYAQDVFDSPGALAVAQLARVARSQCVGVLAVLTPDFERTANEHAARDDGYKLGYMAATTLKGLVQYYQVGNEFDNATILSGHGRKPSDYDNAKFMKARGSILGMIAAIRQVDPSAKIVMCSASWLHFGFLDMLYNGAQPDGSRGHEIPQWDITAWHWYSDMGDITSARTGVLRDLGIAPGINVLAYLHDVYGKPIWITEFGARPNLTEEEATKHLIGNNALAGFVRHANDFDIQSVAMYELYDDHAAEGNYGLIGENGKTPKGRYDAVKSFIESNPMQ
jgi:Glycosyl hydrolase catalytic core